ncbi:MAG: hypothetical protein ACP5UO_00470 [Thermoplasmata archaeon]
MRIQLIGLGSIGKNLLRLLMEKDKVIRETVGEGVQVVSVSDSTGTVITEGLSLTEVLKAKEGGGLSTLSSFERSTARQAIRSVDSDVVVEVTQSTRDGRPGIDHVLEAFDRGKDVVTANKSIMISDVDVMKIARERGRIVRYEATVCGGLPVFNLMDYSIKTAAIRSVEGVFNATSSFVISKMEQGMDISEGISEAVKIGLAEHNPSDDLRGIDSARKGLILHRRIFGSNLTLEDTEINVEEENIGPGMRQVTEVEKKGVTVSLKTRGEKGYISFVKGPSMIIRFNTDTFDNLTLFTEHDGPLESSAAVLNDIILTGLSRRGRP